MDALEDQAAGMVRFQVMKAWGCQLWPGGKETGDKVSLMIKSVQLSMYLCISKTFGT